MLFLNIIYDIFVTVVCRIVFLINSCLKKLQVPQVLSAKILCIILTIIVFNIVYNIFKIVTTQHKSKKKNK